MKTPKKTKKISGRKSRPETAQDAPSDAQTLAWLLAHRFTQLTVGQRVGWLGMFIVQMADAADKSKEAWITPAMMCLNNILGSSQEAGYVALKSNWPPRHTVSVTWHPAAWELPHIGTGVLLHQSPNASPIDVYGYYDGKFWRATTGRELVRSHILHWAYLAKPPGKDE